MDSVDGSLPGVDSFETYTAHFASSLTVPGVEHAVHNAFKSACEWMDWWSQWYQRAKAVSRMLSSKLYRDKLKSRFIVADPLGQSCGLTLDKHLRRIVENMFLSANIL